MFDQIIRKNKTGKNKTGKNETDSVEKNGAVVTIDGDKNMVNISGGDMIVSEDGFAVRTPKDAAHIEKGVKDDH